MRKAGYLAVLLSFGLTATVLSGSSWARDDDDAKNRAKHEQRAEQGDDDEYERRGKHDDYKKKKHYRKGGARDHFIDDDHRIIRLYYGRNPNGLPPGLAKRRGKLPPGLSRGQVVTTEYHTHLLPLPPKLELQLPPPPDEVIRRILGRDILMIEKRTNKVLDVLHDAIPH